METNKLLEAGAKAPQFTLPNAEGDPVSLADAFFRYLCKNDCFPAASWQYKQGFLRPIIPVFKNRFFCFSLIWPEFH